MSSPTPVNQAAWLMGPKARPLEIKPAPYTRPGAHEIVVKNAALAINPMDWKIQAAGTYPVAYPVILGQDVAGEVVEVGDEVTRFRVGDRVLGHAAIFVTKRTAESAFQKYTVLGEDLSSAIPAHVSFASAAVVPLCLSTAACGLFLDTHLGLPWPRLPTTSDSPPTAEDKEKKVVLVWGGSTSVGCNAIQLAAAAGLEVLTTCSARNSAYVTSLGASRVFDYTSATLVDDIAAALHGKTLAGILDCASADGTVQTCAAILVRSNNTDKLIATVLAPPAPGEPDSLPENITAKRVSAAGLRGNALGRAIYRDFLPAALEQGTFRPAPEPMVVGTGLEALQTGMDVLKKGVSCAKVVVAL